MNELKLYKGVAIFFLSNFNVVTVVSIRTQ